MRYIHSKSFTIETTTGQRTDLDIPSNLKGKEILLEHIGIRNVAWLRNDALELIDYLSSKGSFILGGDVLTLTPDGYRHNYDNWYFNFEDGNANQSVEHAKNYINKYPIGNVAFVLIVA